MQQPVQAIPPAVQPAPLLSGTLMNDRSVRQAATIASVAGLIGMLLLCYVFIDAPDFIVGMVNLLAFLLLATVGGYALLAFYGFRLRNAWGKTRPPGTGSRRHDPGRLALSDLRKIRWYSAATMLAILTVYLAPSQSPTFGYYRTDEFGYRTQVSWWESAAALKCGVVLWTACAAVVVLAARRAAWDIAAAAGNLSGPDDVRAFEVLSPAGWNRATATDAPHPTQAAEPMRAIPLSDAPMPTPAEPMQALPLVSADLPPATPAGPVPKEARSAIERIAAAESLNARRDWETVLLTLMVLLLLVAIGMVDTTRRLRKAFTNPQVLSETYTEFSAGTVGWTTTPPPPTDSVRGVLAVAAVASEQLAHMLATACVLWVSLCLMSGPRWRRPVTILLALLIVVLVFDAFAASYFNTHPVGYSTWTAWRVTDAAPVEAAVVPALLLVVLTRPSVQSLFDQRVRKQTARRGGRP